MDRPGPHVGLDRKAPGQFQNRLEAMREVVAGGSLVQAKVEKGCDQDGRKIESHGVQRGKAFETKSPSPNSSKFRFSKFCLEELVTGKQLPQLKCKLRTILEFPFGRMLDVVSTTVFFSCLD